MEIKIRKTIFLILSVISVTLQAQTDKLNAFCLCDTIRIMQDTVDVSLIRYVPVNCDISLTATRPDSTDTNILLAVPAAFTAKNYHEIVGRFVGMDTIIENPTEQETGLCTMNGTDVYIGPITDSSAYYFNAVQDGNTCYFQQMLLVSNGNKVECRIFGKQKPTFRRALCLKDGAACIIESLNRMNIDDFTDVIMQNGYSDAIYLDMGTWSEGFFISENGEKTIIGPLRQNTKFQTNWLVFVKHS